jgi:phospholipid N-methyltransferase
LQDPFHVASIAPSSRWLARLMATGLEAGSRVVELGAGTGTLTEAILDAGVRPHDLHLVEQHPDFVAVLRQRFPQADVVEANAAHIAERLAALRGQVDYVISGLPILWFNRDAKLQILAGSFELLRDGGRFHQFTYLGRPPIGGKILAELRLKPTLLGIAPMNFPPAFVYRLERNEAL